jgi:hypothetical protein
MTAGRVTLFALLSTSLASCSGSRNPVTVPVPQTPASVATDEINSTNARFADQFARRIVGHESEPAAKVFGNVQFLKDVPAANLLTIMRIGYANALGVTCEHCHVATDFASDEKRAKRAAREMQLLHREVNVQLRQMKELDSQPADRRSINCATCHRGRIKP